MSDGPGGNPCMIGILKVVQCVIQLVGDDK